MERAESRIPWMPHMVSGASSRATREHNSCCASMCSAAYKVFEQMPPTSLVLSSNSETEAHGGLSQRRTRLRLLSPFRGDPRQVKKYLINLDGRLRLGEVTRMVLTLKLGRRLTQFASLMEFSWRPSGNRIRPDLKWNHIRPVQPARFLRCATN